MLVEVEVEEVPLTVQLVLLEVLEVAVSVVRVLLEQVRMQQFQLVLAAVVVHILNRLLLVMVVLAVPV